MDEQCGDRRTVSTEDACMTLSLPKLRELASKATPGPWHLLGAPWVHQDLADLTVIAGNPDPHKGRLVAECSIEIDWTDDENDPRIQEVKNAEFIAGFNPETAIALLDRLERAEAELHGVISDYYGDVDIGFDNRIVRIQQLLSDTEPPACADCAVMREAISKSIAIADDHCDSGISRPIRDCIARLSALEVKS